MKFYKVNIYDQFLSYQLELFINLINLILLLMLFLLIKNRYYIKIIKFNFKVFFLYLNIVFQ